MRRLRGDVDNGADEAGWPRHDQATVVHVGGHTHLYLKHSLHVGRGGEVTQSVRCVCGGGGGHYYQGERIITGKKAGTRETPGR